MKRIGLTLLAAASMLVPGVVRAQSSASSTMTVTATTEGDLPAPDDVPFPLP